MIADDIILFAADCTRLDLEDEIIFRKALEKFRGNIEILLQREIAAVEHVSGEEILLAGCAAFLRFRDERQYKFVEFVLETMVGMQRDVNRIAVRYAMDMLGDG